MKMTDSTKVGNYKNELKSTSNDFNNFLIQVGKTYLGKTITEREFKLIIISIIEALNIGDKNEVLDLGCGNGLITNEIAEYAKDIIGFDLNEDMLTVANKHHKKDNIEYVLSNIMDIDFTQYNAEKFYMYEVLQNLEYNMLRKLLQKISNQKESFTLFLASIPDQERILSFYHTQERKKYLFKELLEKNQSHFGNWWYKEHIMQICEDLDLSLKIKDQDPALHTSHYRFDVLIFK